LARAHAAAETAEAALAELEAALADAAGGSASVAAHQQALRESAAHAQRVARSLARLAELRSTAERANALALAEAESAGFADLDAARAAVRSRVHLEELRSLVLRWESELAALRAAASAHEFAELDLTAAPAVELAAAEAAAAATHADERARTAGVAAERARELAARFATARAAADVAAAEHDRLDDSAAPVVHLAKLAKGVAGQRRVALTTYVLRQWFEQVVAAANSRLHGMSSGRYELVRVDEGMTRSERAGLTVQVLDRHTGEQRNARSLSGGETFYTSLALALGLADVVRAEAGGVDLDTLFIDEGFGSLDADTLDQVMGVIDELRDRGRTVGIVSHVSELKERIAERIEVRRLADGSSALRVVA
jgi:exonuclease SbcC